MGSTATAATGALQYTHDPKAMQQRLLALGAPYVLLARFPIWGLATAVGIQVVGDVREVGVGPMPRHLPGGSMRCPVTLLNIDEARHCIAQAYEVAVLLDSPNDGYTLNGVAAFMGTYILRARR